MGMLSWLFGEPVEDTASPKEVNFFSALDAQGHANRDYAILDAARQFQGDELSTVICRLKTQYDCNINYQDTKGNSALHVIARDSVRNFIITSDDFECLYRFLKAGIDPNLQGKNGNTLLHLLARQMPHTYQGANNRIYAFIEFIEYLVAKNKETIPANLAIQNAFGHTPLHELAQYSDDLIIENHHRNPDINAMQFFLQLAEKHNCLSRIRRFKSIDGNSLLHIAAIHGQPKTVKLLIESGWNINSKNSEGVTPLHYAMLGASKSHIEVVRLLIDQKDKTVLNMSIKDLGTPASILECVLQYVKYLEQNGYEQYGYSDTCNEMHKLLNPDDYDPHVNSDSFEEIKPKIDRLCEKFYYTCSSPTERRPQLYIRSLSNQFEKINSHHHDNDTVKDTKNKFVRSHLLKETVAKTMGLRQ